jgi:hypothetical protein
MSGSPAPTTNVEEKKVIFPRAGKVVAQLEAEISKVMFPFVVVS